MSLGLPGVEVPLQGKGRGSLNVWTLEWTYTGTAGEVLLDSDQSCVDPRVATPVADSGVAGITTVRVPKCSRIWVLHASLEVVTADLSDPTDYRIMNVRDIVPSTGALSVTFAEFETNGALTDPNTGARARLTLLLEYI